MDSEINLNQDYVKSSKKAFWIITVIIFIILLVIALLLFFYYKSNYQKNPSNNVNIVNINTSTNIESGIKPFNEGYFISKEFFDSKNVFYKEPILHYNGTTDKIMKNALQYRTYFDHWEKLEINIYKFSSQNDAINSITLPQGFQPAINQKIETPENLVDYKAYWYKNSSSFSNNGMELYKSTLKGSVNKFAVFILCEEPCQEEELDNLMEGILDNLKNN